MHKSKTLRVFHQEGISQVGDMYITKGTKCYYSYDDKKIMHRDLMHLTVRSYIVFSIQ